MWNMHGPIVSGGTCNRQLELQRGGIDLILVTRGGDIQEGLPLVLKSVELCYSHGNMRLLEHLYALLRFLEKKASQMSKAATALSDALHGPFEP